MLILMRIKIFFAVAIQRTVGRVLAGGKKRPNVQGRIWTNYFARRFLPISVAAQKIAPESPETIWQFWDNPRGRTTPGIVNNCFATVEKHRGKFVHKILDNKTIGDYSDLPGFVFDLLKSGKMRYPHFSDLLRLNLLKNHGGAWQDATGFMTAGIPDYIGGADFFVFLVGGQTHFPWSFMQNFFIRARRGSYLNDAWLAMCLDFWKAERREINYFQHQLLFRAMVENDGVAKKLFAQMPHHSEDETLQLVGNKIFTKFDAGEWARIRDLSFMQKLTYKDGRRSVANPDNYPGTYFAKLANGEVL
ncbi:MAG: capsular polysaccharide synthesis protein [Rickettsiales bacterium]|jgi:hypothetical protein|nr:capsular polysaccharide synthesis protein [Rickettsiales bacterium]